MSVRMNNHRWQRLTGDKKSIFNNQCSKDNSFQMIKTVAWIESWIKEYLELDSR